MKNYYEVKSKTKLFYVELKPTKDDEVEIRNYFKKRNLFNIDEILKIEKLEKKKFESIENKKVSELTPISKEELNEADRVFAYFQNNEPFEASKKPFKLTFKSSKKEKNQEMER